MRSSLTPNRFVLFLFYNVAMFQGSLSSCCTLGYHSMFSNRNFGGVLQTYGVAGFHSSGLFPALDVASISHEVSEWVANPIESNATPPWGHTGQVPGCQKDLEVGDPLSGTTFPIQMDNGFTYHVQDLAFFSWFYHQTPSIGVDGLYSLMGTFTTPAAACP